MTTAILKYGDTVKIKPDTRYYGECSIYNPAEVCGTITSPSGPIEQHVRVKWATGYENSYHCNDLVRVDPIILETDVCTLSK